jgi:hypothetical protein
MVWARAVRLIPPAAIGLAPRTATLVNIQTVMWIDTQERRTLPTVRMLGQNVTITITLDHVTWSFGDGQRTTTTRAGKAYDSTTDPCRAPTCPGYDGHIYRTTGTMTVTAQATWRATFTVGNGPATQIPGTVRGPTASARVPVKEARGELVANPPGN